MICLALGLGVLGFVAARKARRCARGYHGWGWHHHHHYGWGGPRRGLFMALQHLDASPAQERAIIGEVDKLRERMYSARRTMKDGRGDLAAAVRGPVLDDAALGAVLGRVDTATGEARAAVLDAVRNIHAVLDDRQREQLADIIDHGWWRGRNHGPHGAGPYRV
jgi:Spy/CpxP family protein refolding chaperone